MIQQDVLAGEIIEAIRLEIGLGSKHYDQRGKELRTVEEVLRALVEDGCIEIEPVEERRCLFEQLC